MNFTVYMYNNKIYYIIIIAIIIMLYTCTCYYCIFENINKFKMKKGFQIVQ